MIYRLMPILWIACLFCVDFSAVEAATWHEYRLAGFRAYGDGDYDGAVEQFESALVVAYEENAPPDQLGAILENLATAYLAAGQPQRAWEAIERWDKILAASAGEPWVPNHNIVRDKLVPRIREALVQSESPRKPEQSVIASAPSLESDDYAIHLESLRSEVNVQSSWRELKAAYPSQLSDKALLVKKVDLEDQGTFFRILATSFATAEDAQKVCTELKGLGQYCVVVSVK